MLPRCSEVNLYKVGGKGLKFSPFIRKVWEKEALGMRRSFQFEVGGGGDGDGSVQQNGCKR